MSGRRSKAERRGGRQGSGRSAEQLASKLRARGSTGSWTKTGSRPGPLRKKKRLTPAGANQIFDMLCRQSDQKENRKVERHRRKNLRKFGNSILYKLHNDNGTNSEGKTCKKYERKHIAQIDQERTAGSIKFGKDAKICHFAAKSTVISADSAKILVDTCFDEKSSTKKSKSERRILDLMTAHDVNPGAAMDLVQA